MASYGKRNDNLKRSMQRCLLGAEKQCEKYHEIGRSSGKPMQMMVVYTTESGFLGFKGSAMLQNLLEKDIYAAVKGTDMWNEREMVAAEPRSKVVLPMLPAPVSKLNAKTLQKIIPNVMRGLMGGRYVKWTDPASKPEWWPQGVCFANPKQRPVEQGDGVVWSECLKKVLASMYNHHGYDAETYVDEPEDDEPEDDNNQDVPDDLDNDADDQDVSNNVGQAQPSPILARPTPRPRLSVSSPHVRPQSVPPVPLPRQNLTSTPKRRRLSTSSQPTTSSAQPTTTAPSRPYSSSQPTPASDNESSALPKKKLPEWFFFQFPSAPGYAEYQERERKRQEESLLARERRRNEIQKQQSPNRCNTPTRKRQTTDKGFTFRHKRTIKPRQPFSPSDF